MSTPEAQQHPDEVNHLMLGLQLSLLVGEHSRWSQDTFGSDSERGPVGPLKHLEKEAKEAYEAHHRFREFALIGDSVAANSARTDFHIELADCLLLLLDANRRSGRSVGDLILDARAKMEVNRKRQWNPSTVDGAVEHIRD